MTKGHNNVLPNAHFRKHWHSSIWSHRGLVRCHFDQAGKKKRRLLARRAKAKAIAPRPTGGAVRPVVRCPTFKYNTKVRAGRGFTLAELKEVGFAPQYAKTIGIAVDQRRKNRSQERFNENVQRLKEYKARLVVLPKKVKARKGDKRQPASAEAQGPVSQATGFILPIVQPKVSQEVRAITAEEKKTRSF